MKIRKGLRAGTKNMSITLIFKSLKLIQAFNNFRNLHFLVITAKKASIWEPIWKHTGECIVMVTHIFVRCVENHFQIACLTFNIPTSMIKWNHIVVLFARNRFAMVRICENMPSLIQVLLQDENKNDYKKNFHRIDTTWS